MMSKPRRALRVVLKVELKAELKVVLQVAPLADLKAEHRAELLVVERVPVALKEAVASRRSRIRFSPL